jgi:hypothetical protein
MVKLHLVLFTSVMFLFIIQGVHAAVGISPGIYNVDFSPNLRQHIAFEFLGDSDSDLEIYAAGELTEYVTLSKKRIHGSGSVDVELRLPESIDTPGVHTIYIGAKPIVTEGQGFGIIGNVKGAINIIVPYPGQYVLVSLAATNANAGQQVNLTTTIDNLGKETVQAHGSIGIYHDETRITEIDLGDFDLKTPDHVQTIKHLDTSDYPAGNYFALAQLSYGDGNLATANSSFKLGELNVRVSNYTRILERKKLNRFEITVASEWNDPIENVYADVEVQGHPINFRTPAAHLDSFGSTVLTGFFDTTGVEEDNIVALITVHYADRTTQETATLSFRKQIDYLMVGLIAAVVVIVALIIFVTYVLRKVNKKRR